MGIIYKNGIPYGNQPNGTVPSGGTTGQVLKKVSNTDYDTEWANESGGGGTSDYTQLSNKPQINSVTLTGNKSLSDIGAASQSDLEDLEDITGDGQLSGFTATDLTGAANELKNTLNSVETNVGKILPVITGSTNNSGYTINTGDYFEANGALYKANAAIPTGQAWSTSATMQYDAAINALQNGISTFLSPTNYQLSPTFPDADTTAYQSGCLYRKSGNVIMLSCSVKIENAQTGYANRKLVTLNLPASAYPTANLSIMASNGDVTGYTVAGVDTNGILAIYPQKTGTTYCMFSVTYVN